MFTDASIMSFELDTFFELVSTAVDIVDWHSSGYRVTAHVLLTAVTWSSDETPARRTAAERAKMKRLCFLLEMEVGLPVEGAPATVESSVCAIGWGEIEDVLWWRDFGGL